jgi:hypothetical protein
MFSVEPDDRSISEQVEQAKQNVGVVMLDIARTTRLRPEIHVDAFEGAVVRITYGSGFKTPSVFASHNPEALAESADYLQEHVSEDLWSPWPTCGVHDKGVYAEVHDGVAVWWCRFGNHLLAEVGRLGLSGSS